MAVGGDGGTERSLEQTPTWAVVVVCSAFVLISVIIEQAIHHVGTVRFFQQYPTSILGLIRFGIMAGLQVFLFCRNSSFELKVYSALTKFSV
jgi:hypothetical protein